MENHPTGSATGIDLDAPLRKFLAQLSDKPGSYEAARDDLQAALASQNAEHGLAGDNLRAAVAQALGQYTIDDGTKSVFKEAVDDVLAALARATPQHSVTEQASMPGDWQVEFDAYSAPGTIRLNSPKWGGCFLGAPKRGDIELPALVYHLLSDMLAQPLASTAATQPEQASKQPGCRMQGGTCACRSGGSFGGCARERTDCCTNEHGRAALAIPASAKQDVCSEMRALCSACGGTGDVHSIDGEWRGSCDCQASTAASEQQAGADEECGECDGKGFYRDDDENPTFEHECDECNGSGRIALTHRATTATPDLVNGMRCDKSGMLCGATNCCPKVAPDIATTAADQQGDTASASIDTPEFRRLFEKYDIARGVANINHAYRELIAYIDSRPQQGAAQAQAGGLGGDHA